MPYSHLTGEEREVISQMHYSGRRICEIAVAIDRHRSTVYRELKRNGNPTAKTPYFARRAEFKAKKRRRLAKEDAPRKLDDPTLLERVKTGLRKFWSPEQIAGASQDDPSGCVSHFAIYRWIERDKRNGGEYWKYLRQSKKKRRKKYGSKSRHLWSEQRRPIEDRPKIVERRARIGDWEGDLMEGLDKKSYLLTLVDRKTRFLITRKIPSRESTHVRKTIVQALRNVGADSVKTLTLDNGTEFSNFPKIEEQLNIKVYFANPYCSWERGTNENTNGLIRQFAPKRTDFRKLSYQALAAIVKRINNRPRKRLNYQTPSQLFANS